MNNTEHPELLKHPNTFASLPGDFSFWHKNREKYAVWALEIIDEQLEERLKQAQSILSDFLIKDYNRHPHITLGQCGFLCQTKKLEDDYDKNMFWQDIEKLQTLSEQKIRLQISGLLTSWAIAPFFPALDQSGDLARFNQLLTHTPDDNYHFTPHITIGLYADAWPTTSIYHLLTSVDPQPALAFEITALKLYSYHPNIVGGQITEEASFNLSDKTLSIHSPQLEK